MPTTSQKPVTIVGAGLAGSLLATLLARKGYKVTLYEKRPDMRKTSLNAGRSINLAISVRGIHALEQIGLADEVLTMAVPMRGRMIHSTNGDTTYQPYGKDESLFINSISRGELNKALMNRAEQEGVKILFDHPCSGMNFNQGVVRFTQPDGKSVTVADTVVIGTDGAGSALRMDMIKLPRVTYSQTYLDHGYKELTMPAAVGGGFPMEKNALHIWPRKQFMLIALPNIDGTFTCTLFLPWDGPESFGKLQTPQEVTTFFQTWFPDALPLFPNLLDDFFQNPTSALATIKTFPWHMNDNALILGDAASGIVPFFGQGMNAAFESCLELVETLEQKNGNWEQTFVAFDRQRKPNTDAIADMAVENFVEMRDLVGDSHFLLKKEIARRIEQKYGDRFVSQYTMVSFRRTPYAFAHRAGKLQNAMLESLTRDIDRADDLNWQQVEAALTQYENDLAQIATKGI